MTPVDVKAAEGGLLVFVTPAQALLPASQYTLFVNGEMNPEAVWYYPEPTDAAADIKGYIAFWKGVQVS